MGIEEDLAVDSITGLNVLVIAGRTVVDVGGTVAGVTVVVNVVTGSVSMVIEVVVTLDEGVVDVVVMVHFRSLRRCNHLTSPESDIGPRVPPSPRPACTRKT